MIPHPTFHIPLRGNRKGRLTLALVLASVLGLVVMTGMRVDRRYPWLWMYLLDQLRPQAAQAAEEGPTHILFAFVDHFEPHDQATMDRWVAGYPALASAHRDADGKVPQHSWFWFFSESDGEESLRFLQQLGELSYEGFGEVELHLHHNADTERTFLEKIGWMIRLSRSTGAMITAEARPRTSFGFIHGMWALDNSRCGADCGINNELILLRRLGCYADFTHPSWGPMHPRTINRLYYATDDPLRPKSYDGGALLRVGRPPSGDLLIFEGPSVVRWRRLRPTYDHGDVTMTDLPTPERIDGWIRAGIHVEGRPEWIFVKVFTHGAIAADHEAVLGRWADRLHSDLEARYNDGKRYVLHYVSAREAYNIAKAAEAGKSGNPNDYREFLAPPYANRYLIASVPYDLLTMSSRRIVARFLAPPGESVSLRLRSPSVQVLGEAKVVSLRSSGDETAIRLISEGEGVVEFILQSSAFALRPQGSESDDGS